MSQNCKELDAIRFPFIDTFHNREKFWKIGNKERDGEFGACFLLGTKSAGSPHPFIFCARPGSRMWEVNFEGEVLSTHQFKQLLGTPPLPIVSLRYCCD